MSTNWLHAYENGMMEELEEAEVVAAARRKQAAKNKGPVRVDMKRTRTSYIAAGKKAARKAEVDTSEIESLNKELDGGKRYR